MAKIEKPTHGNSPEWANIKLQTRHDSMDDYKYDSKPSVLLDEVAQDGQSIADRELKRMVRADVFRSSEETIKQTNSHKRRYK